MSTDYGAVRAELQRGTPPDALCATCRWDQRCVNPPTMTTEEVRDAVKQVSDQARKDDSEHALSAVLLASAVYGGKDTYGEMCPVFSDRLASPDGRTLADAVRTIMRGSV